MSHIKIQSYLIIGKTGSGKTFYSKRILENDLKDVPKDNRFLISPTAKKDMDTTLLPYFDDENVYNQYDDEFVGTILLDLIKAERREIYDDFYYKIDENTGRRVRRKRNKDDKPTYPEYLLFVDDCIEHLKNAGRVKGLSALITKSRHYNINLIITSQYYTAVSPVIRTNIKNIVIFGTNSKEIKKISDEHSLFDDFKTFKKFFQALTDEPYSSVKINYNYTANKVFDDNDITPIEFLQSQI